MIIIFFYKDLQLYWTIRINEKFNYANIKIIIWKFPECIQMNVTCDALL